MIQPDPIPEPRLHGGYLSLWRGFVALRRGPAMAQIAAEVALRHGLTVEQLKGPCRLRQVAWPRHEAMARMRAETGRSLPAIGRFLGGRHHTTVLAGVRAHQAREARR